VPEGQGGKRGQRKRAASQDCPQTIEVPEGEGEYGGKRPGFCPHKREKCQCKDGNGSGICQHQRRKDSCKDCGGFVLCHHQQEEPVQGVRRLRPLPSPAPEEPVQ